MLKEFNPKLVDKKAFTRHYSGASIEEVIEDMGWVSEAYKMLNSLHTLPNDKNLRESIWREICGMQHDLPLGRDADFHLQALKADLQKTGSYQDMQRYKDVLGDLMQGYRKILKERHRELDIVKLS